jgi:hypothetical protein
MYHARPSCCRLARLLLASAAGLATSLCAAQPCAPGTRTPYADWSFFGYACTDACSGQKAGFAWAERNGIAQAAACTAQGSARAQGCRTYAEAAVTAEQAGFEWARENDVTDPCDCSGAGRAFRAGCEAYLGVAGD